MRSATLVAGLLSLALACGCSSGPKSVIVKGKLTNGGKPVLPGRGGVTIVFIPVPFTGNTHTSHLDMEENTYEVVGPTGKGIPTGKYKVALNMMSSTPSPAVDKMNEQYGEDRTPIEVEVTGPELDIDLAKFKPK